jgi:hypothetical protein
MEKGFKKFTLEELDMQLELGVPSKDIFPDILDHLEHIDEVYAKYGKYRRSLYDYSNSDTVVYWLNYSEAFKILRNIKNHTTDQLKFYLKEIGVNKDTDLLKCSALSLHKIAKNLKMDAMNEFNKCMDREKSHLRKEIYESSKLEGGAGGDDEHPSKKWKQEHSQFKPAAPIVLDTTIYGVEGMKSITPVFSRILKEDIYLGRGHGDTNFIGTL